MHFEPALTLLDDQLFDLHTVMLSFSELCFDPPGSEFVYSDPAVLL